MRWRVLTAVVLLCIIVAGGFVCRRQVIRCCDDVLTLLQNETEHPTQRQLELALIRWERSLPLLSSLLHQERLEQVGQHLSAGLGYLRGGDEAGCLAQIGTAIYLLRDIREYDDILLQFLF